MGNSERFCWNEEYMRGQVLIRPERYNRADHARNVD